MKFLISLACILISDAVASQTFYFGADLSYVNEMEDCGAVYTVDDVPVDPYAMFAGHGTNLVRLRLWHTPSWYDALNDGLRYSDYEDVRRSIIRAKAEGMQVLLDFHLSDNWADPGKQVAPMAWWGVVDNLPILQDSLYNYIYGTLNALASEDLLPELVQIGNETNKGILLSKAVNDAGWSLDWDRNAALFNTAIDAVRDIEATHQEDIQIALHIADPDQVAWYIDQFHLHDVTDFDIIGISYYYQWHDELFAEVGEVIADLRSEYPDKEVMILETAYPWTSVNADNANNILSVPYPGYSPFTALRQLDWMVALTQTVIDHGGTGVVYWEPAWVSTGCRTQFATGSSWDNATFFNGQGELLENGGIGWMEYSYDFMTGVEDEIEADEQFMVYVDDGKIIIRQAHGVDEEIRVVLIDLQGRRLREGVFQRFEDKLEMEVGDLASGIYFLLLKERLKIYKVIVYL